MNVLMASFSKKFPTDHGQLSDARRELEQWLRADGSPHCRNQTVIDDVALVVTELAANVIDHTGSSWIRLAVTCEASMVRIVVSQAGGAVGLPDPGSWGSVVAADRGRGLRIVRALCDSIWVDDDGRSTTIGCEVPIV